jgi:hypothetical protein
MLCLNNRLSLDELRNLTHGKIGVVDAVCPFCAHTKRTAYNRRRETLRVWDQGDNFVSYNCQRCGEKGYTREGSSNNVIRPDRAAIERAQAKRAEQAQVDAAERRRKAQWTWSQRQPIEGSLAEIYLRVARGYNGPLPATLGFLAARGEHPPAMIAAYGIADEHKPGLLSIADVAVRAVHLTKLRPDGLGKANTESNKITVASPIGSPIMLAPCNDFGGLAIAEGIEDALSVHAATGLGVWAAGSAAYMPALADVVPSYVECASIFVDDNETGRKNSTALAQRLTKRGFESRLVNPYQQERRAAA